MVNNINNISLKDLFLRIDSSSQKQIAIQSTFSKEKFISYKALKELIDSTKDTFKKLGYSHTDKIALAIEDGPKMASIFIATASNIIACPLNPSYTKDEFIFYIKDLNIRAIILEKEAPKTVILAAKETNIKILYIQNDTGKLIPAEKNQIIKSCNYVSPKSDDIALILHTSGTTSRPKMVPLTHKNLITSAKNISKTLKLKTTDKCFNIMPLFHIHGLIAGLLAPFYKGGTAIIPPNGFNALTFFKNLNEMKPTWYTAVPTMHQIILTRAKNNKEIIKFNPLRFIRSSSASLPKTVMEELENTFNAPVIESYGMTEAAHQMTSNLLPPLKRKSGSVGVPAGPDVKILKGKKILEIKDNDVKGQIIIKGENVTNGYLNNKKANSENFYMDWFLTGDEGYYDQDGFLIISGRLKEIINRGGEKISPLEVDELLTRHKNILQAITFAIPHPKLGEDIAAVIVPKKNAKKLNEKEIKVFCKNKIADFKIPRKIIFADEIPKGSTGKIQRIGLAKKLGLLE